MLNASILFALLCVLGLLLFFSGLPTLSTCALPSIVSDHSGQSFKRPLESVLVILVTAIYAFAAFWNLGNRQSPQSFISMAEKAAVLEMDTPEDAGRLALFPGIGSGSYRIEYSVDAEGWFPLESFLQDHVAVLKWAFIPLNLDDSVRYLRIICDSGSPWLGEVALLAPDGTRLPFHTDVKLLCDEPDTVPTASDFLNSSYFDEIYHVRTAWEHLNGIWPYEISHPPLGKELISLGILIFGMTPFGWRFSGTLIGVLMIPVMYLFVKRLFSSGRIAVLSSVLLASGFMHYVQTRIATIDSFAVFFILLMYYFMYGWLSTGKRLDLALCGFFFGLGAACKWTCLYAGAGLAVLWLSDWLRNLSREGKRVLPAFLKNAAFCMLFFLAVPALIYYLSYAPYGRSEGAALFTGSFTKTVLENQRFMFQYHASIVAEHPYSSRWYQWILDIRPILYYLEYLPAGKRISIAAFVNPVICWGGLFSLMILLYLGIWRRNRLAFFLIVAYLSGLLPWMFISRLTFEYHYFASAVFLIPIISYIFWIMENNMRQGKIFSLSFTVAALILFVLFFPVLSGLPIDDVLGSKLLGWLPSWPI